MRNRLIIDGNAVYELDDECIKEKQERNSGRGRSAQYPVNIPIQERKRGQ